MARRGGRAGAVGLVLSLLLVGACGQSSQEASPPRVDPGTQKAGNPSKAVYTPGAAILADTAFRPSVDGLPFENYGRVLSDGSGPLNMTADDVRTMFGDGVCADAKAGKCDLIPEAQDWLDTTNREMAAGHCYGFSVAAELLWQHKLDASKFGAAATPALEIEDNPTLQRHIAYLWATQLLDSVRSNAVVGAPSDILDHLRKALKPSPAETYTVVIFKPDGNGGHAVTPYAVEDKGGGKFNVLIYDNNWPSTTRAISFDTNNDTWTYNAAINPKAHSEIYSGNTKTQTIALLPTSPGLGTQPCPFCDKRGSQSTDRPARALVVGSTPTEEMYLDGSDTDHADLLITDAAGHRLGYIDGHLVNEIAGARVEQLFANQDWAESLEPHFFVPAGAKYTLTIDGTRLDNSDVETVGVIGPSYDVTVKDIKMYPGEKDTLMVDANASNLAYTASRSKPWTVELGVSDHGADYSFDVRATSDPHHTTFDMALPPDAGTLTIDRARATGASTIGLALTRETDAGTASFAHDGVSLAGGDTLALKFGGWTAPGDGIPLVTTHNGQQTTQTLANRAPG